MRVREKLAWVAVAALGLFVAAAVTGVVSGGPLDPPGPPAASPGGIDGRIPLSQGACCPIVINEPGSYSLTENIIGVSGQHGISIEAPRVTLDLNGFAVTGVPGSLDGVSVVAGFADVTVRNGSVNSWGDDGIDMTATLTGVIERVTARANAGSGIEGGFSSTVRDCTVDGASVPVDLGADLGVVGVRVSAGGTVDRCQVRGYGTGIATGANASVTNCHVIISRRTGVFLDTGSRVTGCNISRIGNGGDDNFGIVALGFTDIRNNTIAQIPDPCDLICVGGAIRVNGGSRVEENHIVSAPAGIDAQGATSTIFRNTFSFMSGALIVNGGDDDVGPISTAATGTSPFANILH